MNGWTGEKTVINEKMISRFPSPFSFESFDALASESLSLFYLDHLWKYSFGSVLTLIQKRAMKSYGWTKFEPIQVNVQGRFTGTKPDAALQRLCVCARLCTHCVSPLSFVWLIIQEAWQEDRFISCTTYPSPSLFPRVSVSIAFPPIPHLCV